MASSVFYRFKSQKEPSRITFDGTGISVFELKRAIIEMSNLGDGMDFELTLTSSDGGEVYDDDTEIVPRSTVVIAKRQPAARPGRGGAARYVSGKPPKSGKNAQRIEATGVKHDQQNGLNASAAASAISELQSEKQREEAVLKLGADMWKHQQKEMAAAAPVRTSYRPKTTGSDNPPPEWYVCNRCGVKGHWIKDCPQNGNPDFDDNRRIKKSIGIPRSRLEVIDKKTILGSDGKVDSLKLPPGAMIDGDGNYVIVKPDKATWNKFQEKASKSAAAQEEEARGSRELQEKGLECPIDKRLFVDPTRTPCCQTTYCNECITNALLDEDLRCPNCGKEGVLIDDLQPDAEALMRVKQFQDGKSDRPPPDEHSQHTDPSLHGVQGRQEHDRNEPTAEAYSHGGTVQQADTSHLTKKNPSPSPPQAALSKKRKAESNLVGNRKSPSVQSTSARQDGTRTEKDGPDGKSLTKEPPRGPKALMDKAKNGQAPILGQNSALPNAVPASMGSMMGMMPMWDPMAMMNPFGAMNAMYAPGFPQMGMSMSQSQGQGHVGPSFGGGAPEPRRNFSAPRGQPFRTFNASRPNPEESAYFRAPVNPQRHQNRRNVPRPTDYREL